MFTARNVFSSSFTISATRGELTSTTRLDRGRIERLGERACTSGVMPPTTFGTFFVVHFALPGSTRSGENARKKSSPGHKPAALENRPDDFVRRTRVGRRLQDDELARPEVLGDHLDGRDDV